LDDRQLVGKLLKKNREAENYFFRTYRERLYHTCVALLGYQDPEAEDITQEAFIIALEKLREFEFRSSLYTWLYRICVNLCYDRIRKRGRQAARLEEDLEVLAGPAAVAAQDREEEDAVTNQRLEVVEAQKALLGEPCRGLLESRDRQQKSYAQLSVVLKVPIGTVMSRLARCRESLKQLVIKALEKDKTS